MTPIAPQEFYLLLPEIMLATSGMVLLVLGSIGRGNSNRAAALGALLSLAVTTILVFWAHGEAAEGQVILAGMFVLDNYAFFWKIVFLLATALTVLLSERFIDEGGYRAGEFYSLILLATTGMLLMASGFNLLSIWISLELMALSSYILAGYFKRERRSNEAALKYFVLGALSSGILLYGISLLYGTTGTLALEDLAQRLALVTAEGNLLVGVGWVLLAIGLFFKVSAVPFHVWTPDVYVGAPTPVTGYLAAASKAASFAILIRIFFQGLSPVVVDWQIVVAGSGRFVHDLGQHSGTHPDQRQENAGLQLYRPRRVHSDGCFGGQRGWALGSDVLSACVRNLHLGCLWSGNSVGEEGVRWRDLRRLCRIGSAGASFGGHDADLLAGPDGNSSDGWFLWQDLPVRCRNRGWLDVGGGGGGVDQRNIPLLLHGNRGADVPQGLRGVFHDAAQSSRSGGGFGVLRCGHRNPRHPSWILCRVCKGKRLARGLEHVLSRLTPRLREFPPNLRSVARRVD